MRTLTPAQLDRAAGALVGLAAGDALGAGYEFRAPPPAGAARMIGGGLGNWAPGEWTDDTQMAYCVAIVAASGRLDPAAVGDEFGAWIRSGPSDVGIQTGAVLSAASGGKELTRRAADYFARHPRGAAGNGSLMRTAPVALAHLGDDAAIASAARAVSALTHGDPLAGEACVLWCVAIDRAVRLGRRDGVRDGLALLPANRRVFWAERLDEAEHLPPSSFTPNGFVVTALQAAYAAVVQTPLPAEGGSPCRHLQDALGAAVSIGHDTDTVAAIAGSLLGAAWGATAVPLDWKAMLHGWPEARVTDLVRLAALTARLGEADSQGWPDCSSMIRHYQRAFGSPPANVALPDDPGVTVGGAAGLPMVRADVVVSLCRIGREDAPQGAEVHEVALIDSPDEADNPNLDFVLTDLAGRIVRWREAERTVFVHCVRAESRTPAVAAAYLAERLGVGGRETLARLRVVLPGARPNTGFLAALDRLWPGC